MDRKEGFIFSSSLQVEGCFIFHKIIIKYNIYIKKYKSYFVYKLTNFHKESIFCNQAPNQNMARPNSVC